MSSSEGTFLPSVPPAASTASNAALNGLFLFGVPFCRPLIYLLAPAIAQCGYPPPDRPLLWLGRNISEKVSHAFPCVRISYDCLRPRVATARVR